LGHRNARAAFKIEQIRTALAADSIISGAVCSLTDGLLIDASATMQHVCLFHATKVKLYE
jgi:hypothetical protein